MDCFRNNPYNKIQLRNSELTKRNNRKSSIKPPGGGLFQTHLRVEGGIISNTFEGWGGLNREGGLI